MAVSAYVLIQVAPGRAFDALEEVKKIEGVKCAHTVTGEYDIIAFVEAESLDKLGETVVGRIHRVRGVSRTVTAIVIR